MIFTLSADDFSAIQAELGYTDLEMSRALFRGPDRSELVREYRTGAAPVPQTVALAMGGLAAGVSAQIAA